MSQTKQRSKHAELGGIQESTNLYKFLHGQVHQRHLRGHIEVSKPRARAQGKKILENKQKISKISLNKNYSVHKITIPSTMPTLSIISKDN